MYNKQVECVKLKNLIARNEVETMDKLGIKLLLFDVYGCLLTDKQQQALALTYNEDYSLGEIAAMLNISRQAVFDSIRRGEELLQNYDEKLGLIAKNRRERLILQNLQQAEAEQSWALVKAACDELGQLINGNNEPQNA